MTEGVAPTPSSVDVVELLRGRRSEIETAIFARIRGIADPVGVDPVYAEALRESVPVALDYALEALERDAEHVPPPPPLLLAQARLAARSGVGLDVIFRRYLAGYSLLSECIVREAERHGLPVLGGIGALLLGRGAVLDRLFAAVSEEYQREVASRLASSERRRVERVERLLAGEPIDASRFDYDLDASHTGCVVSGPDAMRVVRQLATTHDRRLLAIHRDEATVWAWLGGRGAFDPASVEKRYQPGEAKDVVLALGEPADGLSGWRLTHRQAVAALPVAKRRGASVRYADVVLLAAAAGNDLLTMSLYSLYLDPLQSVDRREGALLKTLDAYFTSDRNISSTAAALGVGRRTVARRLAEVERVLGRPIAAVSAALEVAISLDRTGHALEVRGDSN